MWLKFINVQDSPWLRSYGADHKETGLILTAAAFFSKRGEIRKRPCIEISTPIEDPKWSKSIALHYSPPRSRGTASGCNKNLNLDKLNSKS